MTQFCIEEAVAEAGQARRLLEQQPGGPPATAEPLITSVSPHEQAAQRHRLALAQAGVGG